MFRLLAIFIAALTGTVAQYVLFFLLYTIEPDPSSLAALLVNLVGSFLMAFFLEIVLRRFAQTPAERWRWISAYLATSALHTVLDSKDREISDALTSWPLFVNVAVITAGVVTAGALGFAAAQKLIGTTRWSTQTAA